MYPQYIVHMHVYECIHKNPNIHMYIACINSLGHKSTRAIKVMTLKA
jgi:hypothetical protein